MTVTANKRKKTWQHHSGPAVWGGTCFLFAGWVLVLYEPLIFPVAVKTGFGPFLPRPSYFLPVIGQSAIMTGIGLTLFGLAIQLMRILMKLAAASASKARQTMQPSERVVSVHAGPDGGQSRAIPSIPRRAARDPAREVITRGALNGRGYVLFRDGSVVVETLLGPKRFGSMTDAQDFLKGKVSLSEYTSA